MEYVVTFSTSFKVEAETKEEAEEKALEEFDYSSECGTLEFRTKVEEEEEE